MQNQLLEVIGLTKEFLRQSFSAKQTIFIENWAPRKNTPKQPSKKTTAKKYPNVAILFFNESKEEKTFLQNLSLAVSKKLTTSSMLSASEIEKRDGWINFFNTASPKFIITTGHTLHGNPKLQTLVRRKSQNKFFVENVPLIIIEISDYLKNPLLKKSLWETLCHTIQINSQNSRQ